MPALDKAYTILCLHGFLENSTMWDSFHREFEHKYHIITVDLPGHGQSGQLSDSIEKTAEIVINTFVNPTSAPVILMGHSMGGYVALAMIEAGFKAEGLILLNSTCLPDSDEKRKSRNRIIQIVEQNAMIFIREAIPALFLNREKHESMIDLLISQAGQMSKQGVISSIEAMKCRTGRCNQIINQPALIISGKYDSAIDVTALQKAIKVQKNMHVEHKILDHCAHMSIFENPAETFNCIKNFIEITLSGSQNKMPNGNFN
jgi:pimeloyl-ACP methyl ester carboxylesterase